MFFPCILLASIPPRVKYLVPGVTGINHPFFVINFTILFNVMPASAFKVPFFISKLRILLKLFKIIIFFLFKQESP